MNPRYSLVGFLCLVLFLVASACTTAEPEKPAEAEKAVSKDFNPLRNPYFGDLHVHTRYSFDAFIFNVRATPDDAYLYGKGEAIDHVSGYKIQLHGGPLDFVAVTDHSEYIGVLSAMSDSESDIYGRAIAKDLRGETGSKGWQAFREKIGASFLEGEVNPDMDAPDVSRSAWQEIILAAERHYEPGKFTTFIGYEYTSPPEEQNLHRNVIFRGRSVPELPFSSLNSQNPEDLWAWLDERRGEGMEALAIPHNSNGSNGQMFSLETWDGNPLDAAYADLRMRNEPLVEVSQVKGTSEAHPLLSPNDEWADFEIFPYMIATTIPSEPSGSYARDAYLNGLEMEEKGGFNPFKFGLIGASDTHNAGGPVEESNYFSKVGELDGTPDKRGSVPLAEPLANGDKYADTYYNLWGASGLAGVWAEENKRESIYDALRRKETFATSGPRIRIRFFAGRDFPEGLEEDPDMIAKAYEGGVPMGSDLAAGGDASPRFLAEAVRDPNSAPLQRLQIVKGWVEEGTAKEKVFDIACSDGLKPDASTHRCADNGATVDLSDCSISKGVGAAELRALWTDPGFDPEQRAFYYVRALENPSCRWSTWDAVRAGVDPNPELKKTVQDRAWSSPIWYVP